jgi:ring-1,2-phenylacetyl-CoA epoxidase subunit PaaD
MAGTTTPTADVRASEPAQAVREADRVRIERALAAVEDPEIPFLSIVDLGIFRDIRFESDGTPVVAITPTYTGCPATRLIELELRAALDRAGYPHARIEIRLSPPWTTDWITEEGRRKLREAGIAPPAPAPGCTAFFAAEPDISCPHCGSHETEQVAAFGSTACKALWRCRACGEPFEAFKCL